MKSKIRDMIDNRLRKLREDETSARFAIKDENQVIVSTGKKRHIFVADPTRLGILRHVPNHAKVNNYSNIRIAYALYLYALRVGRVNDMKRLHAVDNTHISEIKDNIFCSYDLVLYKLATIRCLLQNYNPTNHWHLIGDVFEGYGLPREDRLLYAFLYHNDVDEFIDLLSRVEDPVPLTIDGLRQEANKNLLRMQKASVSYSSYKLTFVAKGNRFDKKDLANDLLTRGIQAYYWVRPFYNQLHAINYACNAMRGWSQCLIDYYTDPSRARIYSTDEGFENTITDYSPGGHTDHFNEECMALLLDIKGGSYAGERMA